MQSSAENDERVMTLAAAALRLPADEREKFLQVACKDQESLYGQVADVVEWEERMGDFLRRPLIELIDLEPPPKPFQPGQVIAGRFAIMGEAGEGGMGVVYDAFDRKRNQRVAIKCGKAGFARLLSPELEGALRVRHPNICLVNEIHTAATDSGEIDFLTMEFLEGETLARRLAREDKLDSAEALNIARQLCAGLAAAHDAGILHRDLKTGNVILVKEDDGATRAVITDFGLAAQEHQDNEIEGGTPRYMAPELWRGDNPTPASDVYALGVMLYEMVTGKAPFGDGPREKGAAPKLPSVLHKELDPRWDKAILPCLEASPAARPQAHQLLAIFDRRPLWRSPALAVGILALVALLAAFQQPIMKFFKPADIRLAILPLDAPADLSQFGAGVLLDVSNRIKRLQKGKATVSVIPDSDIKDANIHSPAEAGSVLHATHSLSVHLEHVESRVELHASIVDLSTLRQISDFQAQYADANLGDASAGLTGNISSTLHLGKGAGATISANATAPFDRGLYLLKRDTYSFDEAIDRFEEAARRDPHSALPLAGLVEAYLLKFDAAQDSVLLNQARISLQAAEALDPDSVEVRLASGRLNQVEGNYEKALEDYRRVMELEPRNIEAILRAGYSYEHAKMPERAEEYYWRAIALDPEYYQSYEELGAFYYFHGKSREAAEQFRKEVRCAPGRVDAYNNLGGVLSDLGEYREAEEALRHSLQIRESPSALHNLGTVLAYERRDAEAVSYYQRAIALQPGSYLYRLNLADAERRLGRQTEATEAYRAGLDRALADLKNNPLRGLTRAYVAYFKARLGDGSGAEQEIAQALHLSPGDSKVIRRAVLIYDALGMRDRALAVLADATPELFAELTRHPDLADFCRDSRFIRLQQNLHKGA